MNRPQFTFEDLIHPLTDAAFQSTVKDKKPMVFRANSFKTNFFGDITSWDDISKYVANDRAVAGLQVIKPDGSKLCMEKDNLRRVDKPAWTGEVWYEKKYVSDIWKRGGSMILTKASMFSPNISAIAHCLEERYKNTAADAHFYCSPKKNAVSFECHADADDNFLVHAIGSVHWKVYNVHARSEKMENGKKRFTSRMVMTPEEEAKHVPIIDTVLTVGDLLYIPAGMFHKAVPDSARVSISVPLSEFSNNKPIDRDYYDFTKNNS